eukprot:382996-Pyramimonas_sp.AAC.1
MPGEPRAAHHTIPTRISLQLSRRLRAHSHRRGVPARLLLLRLLPLRLDRPLCKPPVSRLTRPVVRGLPHSWLAQLSGLSVFSPPEIYIGTILVTYSHLIH